LTLEEVEQGIAAGLGLDGAGTASFMEDLWTEYLGTLNEDLAEYFAALRTRFRTGILSNSLVGAREREQRRYRFMELCDELIYSHEEGFLKPDARLYLIACERLGVRPEQSVLLDDTPACVEGARAVGMHAITFTGNAQAIGELERLLGAGTN
jgi:putative hydrolase of the HAD superfamily